jgi:hypothetical protein
MYMLSECTISSLRMLAFIILGFFALYGVAAMFSNTMCSGLVLTEKKRCVMRSWAITVTIIGVVVGATTLYNMNKDRQLLLGTGQFSSTDM